MRFNYKEGIKIVQNTLQLINFLAYHLKQSRTEQMNQHCLKTVLVENSQIPKNTSEKDLEIPF